MNNNYSVRDIVHFFLLYVGAIITVYLLPNTVSYFYFALLLILFWRSKKNVFWFILVFFLIDPPLGLFPEDFNYGLPFIKGINLRFVELFVYVAFFKALKQKNRFYTVFNKQYRLLILLTLLLLVYTLFLDSISVSFIITIKWLFVWSLVYSIPKLIDTEDDWIFLFRMTFIIAFVAFLSQLLHLTLGYSPSYLLGTNFNPLMESGQRAFVLSKTNTAGNDLIELRPISSSYIILIALSGAMFFMQYKRKIFKKEYLYGVLIISYLSILLTSTRGWFIAFSLVLFLYFTFIHRIKRIVTISILAVMLIPLLLSVPLIQKQLKSSFKRFSTIESVARGDLSAGGTDARINYSKDLVNFWSEKPLLGWGFSDFYKKNGNGHAGLANLLFQVGIVGYLVFIYFWYKLFLTPVIINKRISTGNPFKGSIMVLSLAFLIFFILNATSGQQFGLYIGFGGSVYSQILYYSYSSFFITMAFKTDYMIKSKTDL